MAEGISELSATALPAGWVMRSLRSLSRGSGRYGCPEPAHEFDADLPRYIRITDVAEDGTLRPEARASVPHALAASFRLAPGDLLFARSGNTVGKTYLYRPEDGDCAHAGYLICFHLDRDHCDPGYVARFTQSAYYWVWVQRTLRQAAQPNINAGEFGALRVPVPPLEEQRRIARAVDAADALVDASARIVDRLDTMTRALLHELLAHGVDERGGLGRGPRRDTVIGTIPGRWKVEPVEALLSAVEPAMRSGPFGSELRKSDLAEEGVPLLGIDNVGVDVFVPRYRRFVSRGKLGRFERYAVRPGDVMITIMGTVGRSCVVPDNVGKALSSKHVWTLTFDPGRYLGALASLQFNHARWVREHFRRNEQGGTIAAIRSETLRGTLLPVPPPDEQARVVNVMRAHMERLAVERAVLAKHRLARQALIDALVSGRVRAA